MVQQLSLANEFGAFCSGARVELPGSSAGPLRGLKFAAKHNFDVEGFVTGAGSPDWKETHAPARFTAQSIRQLLAAGASLVGKTQMDQLAYGTLGVNEHYGTPRNPATPDRIPVVLPVARHALWPAAKSTLHWGPTPHVQFDSPLHFAASMG